MGFLQKKTGFKPFSSFKGQATMEYILLLSVVITLFVVIASPLGTYLARFSGGLIGTEGYYACLTKAGRLPGDPVASQCDQYQQASLEHLGQIGSGIGAGGGVGDSGGFGAGSGAGRTGAGSEEGSGFGEEDGDSTAGNSRNDRDRRNRPSRHRIGSGSDLSDSADVTGNSADSEKAGKSSPRSGIFLAGLGPKDSNQRKKKNSKKNQVPVESDVGLGEQFESSGNSKKRKSKIRVKKAQAYLGERIQFQDEKEEPRSVFQVQSSDKQTSTKGSEEKKNQSLIENQRSTAGSEVKDDDRGWGLSGFLKYLVIAIIIIAILIIIFTQIMEYQNKE